jgi:hypothetical protein
MRRKEQMAQILVEALYGGDREAAKKHGVSVRTIQLYRKRLQTDPELSRFFALKKDAFEGMWLEDSTSAIREAIRFLQRAATQADPTDPNAIHAVAGALKILAEVSLTREVLSVRLEEGTPHTA